MQADWQGNRILGGGSTLLEDFRVHVPVHADRQFDHHRA
jgi:hypothetical protein